MTAAQRLPLPRLIRYLPPVFTCLGAFAVYMLTLEREVSWGDSAELAMQAYSLGVTHPTGYPTYILLGKFFTLFFSEPALATNLLSALSTILAVGLMSLIMLQLSEEPFSSLVFPLFFAFTPLTWSMAVTTEIYNVNLLFFGLTLFLLLSHDKQPAWWKLPASSIAFGFSLGVHLLNLLLLPLLLFLVYRSDRRVGSLAIYLLGFAASSIPMLSFSYFRAQDISPLGTQYIPSTLANYWNYLTCLQCDVVALFEPSFYLHRLREHAGIISANYAHLGLLLGILGLAGLWREQRRLALVFTLIVLLEVLYLTTYQSWEYYNMAGPAHYVFVLGMPFSPRVFAGMRKGCTSYAAIALALALCAILLTSHFPQKFSRAKAYPVSDFVSASFRKFPANAIVVSDWSKFTALLYFQKIHHLREDLLIIERTPHPRYYHFGEVSSYLDFIQAHSPARPVVIDRQDERLAEEFTFEPLYKRWYLALRR